MLVELHIIVTKSLQNDDKFICQYMLPVPCFLINIPYVITISMQVIQYKKNNKINFKRLFSDSSYQYIDRL